MQGEPVYECQLSSFWDLPPQGAGHWADTCGVRECLPPTPWLAIDTPLLKAKHNPDKARARARPCVQHSLGLRRKCQRGEDGEIQNLSFNANNEFTFSFWIKPDYNNASSNQYLFDIRSQSTIGHAAAMISNSNGNGRLRYGVHGTTNHSETTQALLPDNFTQICFVHDSNSDKLRIFFNGKIVFDTYQADFLPNSSNLRLGYRTVSLDGINFFKGTIDDFRAHSRALSEREATALYGLNNL